MTATLHAHLLVRYPALRRSVVSRRALRILSRQVEDLLATAGADATLLAGFQDLDRWRAQRGRYERLAVGPRVLAIYAAATDADRERTPLSVALRPGEPLTEDWFLIAFGPDLSVMLCGREIQGPRGVAPLDVVLSTDPRVVGDAAAFVAGRLAESLAPAEVPWPVTLPRWDGERSGGRFARQNDALLGGLVARIEALGLSEQLAAENARRRLAYTLHDESLQYLLAAHQDLQAHADRLEHSDADLDRAREHLAHGLEHLRSALAGVGPDQATPVNVDAALTALAEQIGQRGGFGWTVTVHPAAQLTPAGSEIVRIARELLINTAKHAGATHAHIALTADDRNVRLRYRDDGRGFDQAHVQRARSDGHIGLTIVEERVRLLGGTHTHTSAPGAGVSFEAVIPRDSPERTPLDEPTR